VVRKYARTKYRIGGRIMAELRYGPNGESLAPGTPAYEKGSKVRPVVTNTGTNTSGYPSFTPNFPGIELPGVNGYVSEEAAKSWFKYAPTRNKAFYNDFIADLARKGIAKKYAQLVWNDAIGWTQSIGSTTGKVTEYLNVMDPSMYKPEGDSGPKYGTQAQKDSRVTQYSGSSAAQQISDEMERRLGRRATQSEIDAYTAGVNAAAKKEPSIFTGSTTTTAPKGKNTLGSTATTGTQTTGFDPTMFARNFAMSRPDYAESFAANTFLGLVEKLLKDPNAIGNVVGG
jgi:hypothetical protein